MLRGLTKPSVPTMDQPLFTPVSRANGGTGPQLQGADAQQDAEASQDVEVLPPHAAGPMRELLDSITTEDLDTVERDVYATMLLFTD